MATSESSQSESKHFVLVHGREHGAWCWYKLVPLLRSAGHKVTALDLGASGIHPKQVHEVPLISDYFSPLTEFMASLSPQERVILVGHSFGGLALTYAMERFPTKISVAIFVTALMPSPLADFTAYHEEAVKSRGDAMDITYTYGNGTNNPPTASAFGPTFLAQKLYDRCHDQDLTLATLLARPLYEYSGDDVQSTLRLSPENYESVKRVFIIVNQDSVLRKYFQEWMINQNPPDEVREITGSDHMVMMSNPNALFAQLHDLSQKYS